MTLLPTSPSQKPALFSRPRRTRETAVAPERIGEAMSRLDHPQVVFRVPIPPSSNNLFTNIETGRAVGVSRAKSKKYRSWLHEAGWEIKRQSPPFFIQPVAVLIEVDLPRQRDMDNAIKPLLDLLVYVRVLKDDSLVDDLRIIRRGDKSQAAISIWLMHPIGVSR